MLNKCLLFCIVTRPKDKADLCSPPGYSSNAQFNSSVIQPIDIDLVVKV